MMTYPADLKKKQRDYMWLLIFMLLSYIQIAIVDSIIPSSDNRLYWTSITRGLIVLGWYVFVYRVTSNFYDGRRIRIAYFILLAVQCVMNGLAHASNEVTIESMLWIASIAYASNLVGMCWIFGIILRDIFTNKHDLLYSLLGAANIYFMIPLIFSFLYCLVSVHNPAMVGAAPVAIREFLFVCFNYSWFVTAGIDFPGTISQPIQALAVLQSIAGNLFIVFIIGRLMSVSH